MFKKSNKNAYAGLALSLQSVTQKHKHLKNNIMGLLKFVAIGAAVAYGVSYVTKKRVEDGRSLFDDWADKAPEFMDKVKQYGEDALNNAKQTANTAQSEI
jgi:hypothetical protein